jgi:hypothetical protein
MIEQVQKFKKGVCPSIKKVPFEVHDITLCSEPTQIDT